MSEATPKRVTSADVAREAGVARTTVSYVLNRTPHQTIPEGTRNRVLDTAKRLGYTPSAAARTLKRGRSDVVLCLLPPWPLGSAAGILLAELSTAFAQHGLTLVTHIEQAADGGIDKVWSDISPAAVLTYHRVEPASERAMRAAGIRSVMVLFSDGEADAEGAHESAQLIRPDTRIGRLQADYLLGIGHERIGYAYPESPALEDLAAPRFAGVTAACAAAGTAAPEMLRVALDAESAAIAIAQWRALPEPVTAVCAYSDEVALALLAGARLAGVNVPRDLALIGADDIPLASLASPPLTTIAVDHIMEARRIVALVTATLADAPTPDVEDAADLFTIVVRESA